MLYSNAMRPLSAPRQTGQNPLLQQNPMAKTQICRIYINLPNAFASTEIFMGFGASVASLFVSDVTSKIVLSSIAAAALLAGASTNALKTYYNNPENDYLFETEFRAYIENFTKKRFKHLTSMLEIS